MCARLCGIQPDHVANLISYHSLALNSLAPLSVFQFLMCPHAFKKTTEPLHTLFTTQTTISSYLYLIHTSQSPLLNWLTLIYLRLKPHFLREASLHLVGSHYYRLLHHHSLIGLTVLICLYVNCLNEGRSPAFTFLFTIRSLR